MASVDCLIIGAAEQDRNLERRIVLDICNGKEGDSWGKFLVLNYIEYDNDVLMSHQLGSAAYLAGRDALTKDNGVYRYADVTKMSSWRTPLLGGMFVYQYLKSRGFEVDLIQHVQLQAEALDAALRDEPRAIAISTTLITSPMEIRDLVRYCRERSPSSFIVLGGMTIWNQFQVRKADLEIEAQNGSAAPLADGNGALKKHAEPGDLMSGFGFLGADALVVDAYGVATMAEILGRLRTGKALDNIPNTVLFENGSAVSSLDRQGETFDTTRMRMNWDLVEDRHIDNIVNIRTQISCPFRCSFCSYPSTQGPVIKAEVENFEAELVALARRGVQRLMIVDDTFNVPPKRFVEILKVLRKYDFGWYAFIRCQFITREQADLMKASGCLGVYLGLESVDDETLKRMNKVATHEDFYRGIDLLASRGISTFASFIAGFPGDTVETVGKIKDFVENSGLDYYNVKPFWYDHSTPIARRAHEFELTGQGYNWTHAGMKADQAYDIIKDLIIETKCRYVALHSGELWEFGQFGARGLSKANINDIYDAHNTILRQDLRHLGKKEDKQRVFSELALKLRDVTLTKPTW